MGTDEHSARETILITSGESLRYSAGIVATLRQCRSRAEMLKKIIEGLLVSAAQYALRWSGALRTRFAGLKTGLLLRWRFLPV
jgi:hypothetical protein